jgi:putative tryptophan/tyrosine transport system substrate-binding protein
MKRCEFITLLGGAATLNGWPLVAGAQQTGKLPAIGVLGPDAPGWSGWTAAFAERLSQLHWIEGRTVAIEYRWSEGRPERVAEIAAEFVRLKVDVIVTYGGAVITLKQTTAAIPIVVALAIDPIGSGLVANLSRPGGNVTGLSLQATDIAGKRLELLREVVPHLHRLAIMFDAGYPACVKESGEAQAAARTLGVEVAPLEIRRAEDIAPAFAALTAPAEALYVVDSALALAMPAASSRLRSAHGCRRSSVIAIMSKPEVSCPTDQTSRTCSGAPPRWSIRFCTGRSPPTFPSSSRPNSILSSISRPPRRWSLVCR